MGIRLVVAAVTVVVAFGSITASGVAGGTDRASAVAYVHEATSYVNVVLHSRAAITRAAARFVSGVRTGCANLVPTHDASVAPVARALELEADDELLLRLIGPVEPRAVAFSASVARLPWRSSRIRTATADEAREEARLAKLTRLPSLCADIAGAHAGGFATVPAETERFLAELGPILTAGRSQPSQSQLLALLKADLAPAQIGALKRLQQLGQAEEREINGISTTASGELVTVLGAAPYP